MWESLGISRFDFDSWCHNSIQIQIPIEIQILIWTLQAATTLCPRSLPKSVCKLGFKFTLIILLVLLENQCITKRSSWKQLQNVYSVSTFEAIMAVNVHLLKVDRLRSVCQHSRKDPYRETQLFFTFCLIWSVYYCLTKSHRISQISESSSSASCCWKPFHNVAKHNLRPNKHF